MGFVHLHVHSYYSFLDGASSLDRLLEKADDLDMPVMALTDHNRLTGAVRFYERAKALGIKPIIGTEIDLEGGYHLILLCKDRKGYSNLCRLLTEAHLSNHGSQCSATREALKKFSRGLVALSGCSKGELPTLLAKGKADQARAATDFYRETFGDDFFIELIRHPSRSRVAASHLLAEFARKENVPIVATNNVHYAEMEEYRVKELLNAIDQNIPVSWLQRNGEAIQRFA